ncbi:MAG: GtrA family protein [Candidatus Liptonbacteria bacterium]|nr:GtrA family protein [Candidatus Liptonbacteria bacterium]
MEYAIRIIKENWRLYVGYAFFSGIAVVADLVVLYVLTEFAGIWYFYSAAIAYLVSIIVSFVLNKMFNFKDRSRRILAQFSIFVGIALISITLNQALLYLFVEFFGIWYMLANFFALMAVANFSFYCHKNYTFKLI